MELLLLVEEQQLVRMAEPRILGGLMVPSSLMLPHIRHVRGQPLPASVEPNRCRQKLQPSLAQADAGS